MKLTKELLIESIALSLNVIDDGLRLVDSNIQMINDFTIDILAVDSEDRIVVIYASPRPITHKSAKHNMLNKAIAGWGWLTDFKRDFLQGIHGITGVRPVMIPPKLLIVAPGFDDRTLRFVNYCSEKLDLSAFEFNTNASFDPLNRLLVFKDGDLTELNTSFYLPPDQDEIDKFNTYQDRQLQLLRDSFNSHFGQGTKAYDPLTFFDINRL